jgi:hypothetical protein
MAFYIFFSCEKIDLPEITHQKNKKSYLKYYYEDNQLVQSFEYEGDRIIKLIKHGDNDSTIIKFVYHKNGLADSALVKEKYITRQMVFIYQDSVLMGFEVRSSNNSQHQIIFTRDQSNRIIRMALISHKYGILNQVDFFWEGQNILKYESTSFNGMDNPTYVYEFKSYDHLWNPYNSVFGSVGFNFIDFIPLADNNWIELDFYRKNYYNNYKVNYVNKFSYCGQYPYVKQSSQKIDKEITQVYAEYNYKNTLY